MALRYACELVILDPNDLTCDCAVDDTELTEAELTNLLEHASDLLVQVTGLPVGRCQTIYRPCRSRCHGLGCTCGCNLDGILLPGLDPEIVEIRIDGALVPDAEWAPMRSPSGDRYLERFHPSGYSRPWPSSQPVGLQHTEAGTFSITVEAGTDVSDPVVRNAVNDIVCEILTKLNSERNTEDGAVAAVAYGVSLDYRRFSDPTDQETMALAGLSWIRRFVLAYGGSGYSVIDSNDLHNGWELRVNGRDEAIAVGP